ncbi:MAG: PAS domain-containing protein [Parvibaculum sp.]|uniref:PAS domain-containing protein n=1 Tax=Parvibaculum sp. TaxID=2024848 RepID=UPI002717C558|nr:PAS domain-containing protein [Parvibaculum sp.]MDO8838374.1 PAS domain-containing protein [Parvibaculum sp.]
MSDHPSVIDLSGAETVAFRRLKDMKEPLCIHMLEYWKSVRGTRAMPRPDEMDPIKFARFMPNLLMLQVNWDPFDLTYRLLGEDIVAAHGANFRGRRVLDVDEHKQGFGSILHDFYKFVAEAGRPYAAAGSLEYMGRGAVTFEGVYMPLSIDGERTDRILGASVARPVAGA